jgi:hypothetical protein
MSHNSKPCEWCGGRAVTGYRFCVRHCQETIDQAEKTGRMDLDIPGGHESEMGKVLSQDMVDRREVFN